LTKNASQGSITQQIFPLIEERILSELPEPPLTGGGVDSVAADSELLVAAICSVAGLDGISLPTVLAVPAA
jgi:hypothetical protein